MTEAPVHQAVSTSNVDWESIPAYEISNIIELTGVFGRNANIEYLEDGKYRVKRTLEEGVCEGGQKLDVTLSLSKDRNLRGGIMFEAEQISVNDVKFIRDGEPRTIFMRDKNNTGILNDKNLADVIAIDVLESADPYSVLHKNTATYLTDSQSTKFICMNKFVSSDDLAAFVHEESHYTGSLSDWSSVKRAYETVALLLEHKAFSDTRGKEYVVGRRDAMLVLEIVKEEMRANMGGVNALRDIEKKGGKLYDKDGADNYNRVKSYYTMNLLGFWKRAVVDLGIRDYFDANILNQMINFEQDEK